MKEAEVKNNRQIHLCLNPLIGLMTLEIKVNLKIKVVKNHQQSLPKKRPALLPPPTPP